MNTVLSPAQGSLRPVPCRRDHSVSTHLTCPAGAFTRYPSAPVGSPPRGGSRFRHSTQAHRSRPAVSSSSSYGLVTPRRLLSTSPRGDAVIVGYGPESVCPERTSTSLSWRHCRRTSRRRPFGRRVVSRAHQRSKTLENSEVLSISGELSIRPARMRGATGALKALLTPPPSVRLRSSSFFVLNPLTPSSPSPELRPLRLRRPPSSSPAARTASGHSNSSRSRRSSMALPSTPGTRRHLPIP